MFKRNHIKVKVLLFGLRRRNVSFNYCENLVKTHEYENFLCTLLLPYDIRVIGMTVRAFNVELSLIKLTQTSDSFMAKRKFQFWRESIDETFQGRPPAHPVSTALAYCLEKKMLPKKMFSRLIDVRENHLDLLPFMSVADVESFGELAVSSIFSIILHGLNSPCSQAQDAATYLGRASSLITLLRSADYFAQMNIVLLPAELLQKHSVTAEEILRKEFPVKNVEIVSEVAGFISENLEKLRELHEKLNPREKVVFLPRVQCELFLRRLKKYNFDVYNSELHGKQFMLPWHLFVAKYF